MTVFFLSILVFSKWRDEFRAFMYMYIYLLNSQYLARSCPSSLSSRSLGPFSLVHTGAMAMETPWSLAPISAPHIQAGLLRITAWVFLTWSTSMYVHFNKRKLKHWLNELWRSVHYMQTSFCNDFISHVTSDKFVTATIFSRASQVHIFNKYKHQSKFFSLNESRWDKAASLNNSGPSSSSISDTLYIVTCTLLYTL